MTRTIALLLLTFALAACRASEPDRAARTRALAIGAPADTLVVYKDPNCGCCNAWVDHVKENGFAVVVQDMKDVTPIKRQLGVPAGRTSCHTASVRGYTLEGHVPADLIRRMLDEKPRIRGLTVPGMPIGSPGMEGLIKQSYEVLSFDSAGETQVYARR